MALAFLFLPKINEFVYTVSTLIGLVKINVFL